MTVSVPDGWLGYVLSSQQWPGIRCPYDPEPSSVRVVPESATLNLYCSECGLLLAHRPMSPLELDAHALGLDGIAWSAGSSRAATPAAVPKPSHREKSPVAPRRPWSPSRLVTAKCPECGLSSPGLSEHETLCDRQTLLDKTDILAAAEPVCNLKFNRRGDTVIFGRVLKHLGSDGLDHDLD